MNPLKIWSPLVHRRRPSSQYLLSERQERGLLCTFLESSIGMELLLPWFSSHILDSLPAYSTRTCVTLLPVSRLSHRTRSRPPVVPTAAPRHDPRFLLALSTGLRGIRSQPPSSLASCHTRSRSRFSMDVSAASTIDEVPANCPQTGSETGALIPHSRC